VEREILTGGLEDGFLKMFDGILNKGFTTTSLNSIEFIALLLGCDSLLFLRSDLEKTIKKTVN
jgi:hypothetical protein